MRACVLPTPETQFHGLLQMQDKIQPQERRLQKQSQSSCKHWLDRVLTPLKVGEEESCGPLSPRTEGPTVQQAQLYRAHRGYLSLSSQQPCRYLVLFRHEETEGQRVMTLV